MQELNIGEIPQGSGTLGASGFMDVSAFLWALILIGAAFFFFIGTFNGLRRAFQDGSRITPSIIWFLSLVVFIYGINLLFKSFNSAVVPVLILGAIIAGIISFTASLSKKDGENKNMGNNK